jgi:lipopolysaccharide transport system permease protein
MAANPARGNSIRSSITAWTWATGQLVRRDLRVRYKNSALGFFWSFLNPLMQITILTIVFKYIMGSTVPNFSMELFTCYLPWMFFNQSLNDGAVCVAHDFLLVKKYAFPRIIIPISSLLSNFIHLCLGYVVLLVIFLVLPVALNVHFLWVIPLLVIQCALTLGLVLMLATLHMYYEDIKFILGSVTQLLFFLCPIVYTIEQVVGSDRLSPFWKDVYLLGNPLTPLFIGYRTALLHGGEWPIPHYFMYLGVSALWALAALLLGCLVWRRYQWHFPELV